VGKKKRVRGCPSTQQGGRLVGKGAINGHKGRKKTPRKKEKRKKKRASKVEEENDGTGGGGMREC